MSAALEGRIKLKEQIPTLLQEDETKLCVTKCIVADLNQRAEENSFWKGALAIANSMSYLACAHKDLAAPGDCIRLLLRDSNKQHLVVGIQDVSLRDRKAHV